MNMNTKKIILSILFILSLASISSVIADTTTADTIEIITRESDSSKPALVYHMTIEGVIGVVTETRISEAIEIAEEADAELLIIEIYTPGGFSNATRSICVAILNSEVPVCVYVSPSGAHAGSAGVYIAYSANFAVMAPTTNIGSAHPVSGSGAEIDSVMNEKVTNDAVAQIKSYAEKRGRNIDWAEKAVRESVNITDKEALDLGVINYIAVDIEELLKQVNGDSTETSLGWIEVNTTDYEVEYINPSFVQTLLEIITRPEIAFALLSIGGMGIIIELYNPGSILPGVVGVICILIAAYAFQFLPINYAGILLMIVAAILFIAEIKVVSHGVLTVGGLVALFFGGLMLIDTVDPTLRISISFLIMVVLFVGALFSGLAYLVIKAHKRKPIIGKRSMAGKEAEVRTADMVYVDGALWKAVADEPLTVGGIVEIIEETGLTLKVKTKNK